MQKIATADIEHPAVVGAGIVLKVMAGDIVKPKVFGWFNDGITGNTPANLPPLAELLAAFFLVELQMQVKERLVQLRQR